MIGQTLGHYRILEQLGAGGMGVVYRARDERLERDVAVKVLPAGSLGDESARARFRREALALAKLTHPNIAHVYDFDSLGGTDYLAMEYVPGSTLSQKLTAGPLPEKELLELGGQVASALEEAHEYGIIHRDLKPGNIVITPKGQAKVLDFGLAKLLRPGVAGEATQTLTEPHSVAGTLPYMAPEQLQGEAVDARADIYALGCVLYEMSAGRRPFQEDSAPRLTDAILHATPVSPRAVNPRISPELERLILKCLEKDADNRYQSAKELRVDLRRSAAPSSDTKTAVAPPRGRIGGRLVLASAGAAIVVLAILFALNAGGWRDRLLSRPAAIRIRSLAVLPLENFSHDPEQEYFADGITEALITDLAQISALKVISRTSVMRYKGANRPPLPQIAKELNVDAVIEGSVQRSGDQVRVTAQMILAPTDKHLWAKSYDRDLRNLLSLQSDVAQAIAQEIQIKLTPQEESRFAAPRSVNPAAQEAYLRGLYSFHQGRDELATPRGQEQIRQGIAYFHQSIQLDPDYALAYAGLASAEHWLGAVGGQQLYEDSLVASTKALQLDDSLSEAHTARGYVLMVYKWSFAEAEKEAQRAIELNPNNSEAHHSYGLLLMGLGRLDESIGEFERALQLDPLTLPLKTNAGNACLCAGQNDRALSLARAMFTINLNYASAHSLLGRARLEQGASEEGISELRRAVELSGGDPFAMAFLARAYVKTGKPQEAAKLLAEMTSRSQQKPMPPYAMAAFHAVLGDKDQAFMWLQKTEQQRVGGLVYIRCNPLFESLRGDPRYADLLRRIGFPR